MPTLAAVTYLMFLAYLANFLMLTAVAARQTGRPVWLLDSGEPGQRVTGWAFRAAFVGAVLWPPVRLATGGLAGDPLAGMAGVVTALAGHLFVVVGATIALVAQYHMGAAWRIGAAEGAGGELVRSGPFGLSRNPVFLGQMLLFAGLFLAFPDALQALVSAAAIAAALVQARIEERVLARMFGAAYADYAQRVPRWIGRPRPLA